MNEKRHRLIEDLKNKLSKALGLELESLDFDSNHLLFVECANLISAINEVPDKYLMDCPTCNGVGLRDGLDLRIVSEFLRAAMSCYDCMGSGKFYVTKNKCKNIACGKGCPFCKGTGYQLERVKNIQ